MVELLIAQNVKNERMDKNGVLHLATIIYDIERSAKRRRISDTHNFTILSLDLNTSFSIKNPYFAP